MANSKRELFIKRRLRVRNKLRKMAEGRPRLSVHRSNRNISVQLIDDVQGRTLAAASTLEKDLGSVGVNNVEAAARVRPWTSSISWTLMLRFERCTERRGRPSDISRSLLRTRRRRLMNSSRLEFAIFDAPYFFLPSLRKMYSPL